MVDGRGETRVRLGEFAVLVTDIERVKGSRLLKRLNAEKFEECLAVRLVRFNRAGCDEAIQHIRAPDHAAVNDCLLEEADALRARQLVHNAAAACGLAADGDITGVAAERLDVTDNPLDACLLVEVTEVGRSLG